MPEPSIEEVWDSLVKTHLWFRSGATIQPCCHEAIRALALAVLREASTAPPHPSKRFWEALHKRILALGGEDGD